MEHNQNNQEKDFSLEYLKQLQQDIRKIAIQKNYFQKNRTELKLLSMIDDVIKGIETNSISITNEEWQQLLTSILKLKKFLTRLTFSEKVQYFMMYINDHEIPKRISDLHFSDICAEIEDNSCIGAWFIRVLYQDLAKFQKEYPKYQNVYPNAYQKIEKILIDFKPTRAIKVQSYQKVETLMKYLDQAENEFPCKRYHMRFSDLSDTLGDTLIYDWINNNLKQSNRTYMSMIEQKKDTYPIAYQRIMNKMASKNRKKEAMKLSYEERLLIVLEYLTNHPFPKQEDKITFHDLNNACNDLQNFMTWLIEEVIKKEDQGRFYLQYYQHIYPIATAKIEQRIKNYSITMSVKKKLNTEGKIEILMKYLNEHPNLSSTETTRFCDISNTNCDVRLYSFFRYLTQLEETRFNQIIEKYKYIYPAVCEILQTEEKKNRFVKIRNSALLSTDKKMKALMDYLETHDRLSENTRFCDIVPTTQDDIKVSKWWQERISKYTDITENMISYYKATHPNAYQKAKTRIEALTLKRKTGSYTKKIVLKKF